MDNLTGYTGAEIAVGVAGFVIGIAAVLHVVMG